MSHTAQSLLNAVLNSSATGLIDPSLSLSGVTAEYTADEVIAVTGTATKNGATLNLSVNIASIEDLLSLVASALNAEAPKAKTAPKTKTATKAAPAPEPEPVAADDDTDDAF